MVCDWREVAHVSGELCSGGEPDGGCTALKLDLTDRRGVEHCTSVQLHCTLGWGYTRQPLLHNSNDA
eukprot:scaffold4497_cov152-Skeletonema_marinoi.AAC.6